MRCPYLPGRTEQQVFGKLSGPMAQANFDDLSRAGFRRRHRVAYRPACPGCSACVPVRVLAQDFAPGRSLRRIRQANADLEPTDVQPVAAAVISG